MAIQLSNLTVNPDVKKVREYVSTPQGSIEIYEPTLSMVNEILEIQKEDGFDFASEIVSFNEHTLLTKVFPLLTNIETGNLSEDELQKIIDNPSIHLLIAQNVVAQVLSEANKLYAERLKAELASAETVLAQADLLSSIPSIINEHAKRNPEVAESLKKIEDAQAELEASLDEAMKEDSAKSEEDNVVLMMPVVEQEAETRDDTQA